ncbi:MAG TPA: hypothetical protein VEX64_08400 [Pyrinomonadaceae bacterium]|nr:hypothetical protein [Pyrinomonadaceae bacterium]
MKGFVGQLHQNTPRVLALLLCLWLSGAVSVIQCGAMEMRMQAAKAAAASDEGESCPMSGNHDCCKGKEKKDRKQTSFAFPQKGSPQLDCCAFVKLPPADPARRVNQIDAPATVAGIIGFEIPALEEPKISSSKAFRSIPRDRGSTFLRNCVFRI